MTLKEMREAVRKRTIEGMHDLADATNYNEIQLQALAAFSATLQALALDKLAEMPSIGDAITSAGTEVSNALNHMTGQMRYVSGS